MITTHAKGSFPTAVVLLFVATNENEVLDDVVTDVEVGDTAHDWLSVNVTCAVAPAPVAVR